MSTAALKRYDGIQCLRAIAAILVVTAHLKIVMPASLSPVIRSNIGAIGVDIFFVISGFVIALTSERIQGGWSAFLKNRFARVVPFYYVMSGYFLLAAIFHHTLSFRQGWNTFLFLPLFDRWMFTHPVHLFGWSLSFEIWFYLSFAAILAVAKDKVLLAQPLLFLGGVAVVLLLGRMQSYFAVFAFYPMALEFCAGILLYRFRNHLTPRIFYVASVLAVLLLFPAVATEHMGKDHQGYSDPSVILGEPYLGLVRLMLWGSEAIALVVAVVAADFCFRPRWPRWLVKYGDASYSLYLIQPYGLMLLARLGRVTHFPALVYGVLWMVFPLVFCFPLHTYIEVPLTNFSRRWIGASKRTPSGEA